MAYVGGSLLQETDRRMLENFEVQLGVVGSQHQLPGRFLLLQHAPDLCGGQGSGPTGQDHHRRVRYDPVTLGGVKEGTIAGTVVQQPFEWAYQGMKLMAAYVKGDKSGIPANQLIIIPTKIVTKDTVDAYEAGLKKMQGK